MKRTILLSVFAIMAVTLFGQKGELNLKKGLAVDGYDVVAYFDGIAKEGSKELTSEHEGATYRFSSKENKQKFDANPEGYLPQYGGYCAYAVAKDQGKVSIDPETFEVRDGKLFLFYNKLFTNTLKSWLEEGPEELQKRADENWPEIK